MSASEIEGTGQSCAIVRFAAGSNGIVRMDVQGRVPKDISDKNMQLIQQLFQASFVLFLPLQTPISKLQTSTTTLQPLNYGAQLGSHRT